jgi:hypothetical protein
MDLDEAAARFGWMPLELGLDGDGVRDACSGHERQES